MYSELSNTNPVPNVDTCTTYSITALSTNARFTAPIGTPADQQRLFITIKDDGTSRNVSWDKKYAPSRAAALPTMTIAGVTQKLGFLYDAESQQWICFVSNG